jgi:hypothetical protein
MERDNEDYDNSLNEFFGQLLAKRRHVCNIMIAVSNVKTGESRREKLLSMVRC